MSDTPAHHEQPKLDRVLAAHKRRARLIAQLHEQAIAAANDDLSAPQNAIKAGITCAVLKMELERLDEMLSAVYHAANLKTKADSIILLRAAHSIASRA